MAAHYGNAVSNTVFLDPPLPEQLQLHSHTRLRLFSYPACRTAAALIRLGGDDGARGRLVAPW
jgi:hypothetical protein